MRSSPSFSKTRIQSQAVLTVFTLGLIVSGILLLDMLSRANGTISLYGLLPQRNGSQHYRGVEQ
jgi:hypothetical protein